MLSGNAPSPLRMHPQNEGAFEAILGYVQKLLRDNSWTYLARAHAHKYEEYTSKGLLNLDSEVNVPVTNSLDLETLFFIRKTMGYLSQLYTEDDMSDESQEAREKRPFDILDMLKRIRLYKASLSRLRSVYIEQKSKEQFLRNISNIPPVLSDEAAVNKLEVLLVDTRNILESRQDELIYLENNIEATLDIVNKEYHSLISSCFNILELYHEHRCLLSEHKECVSTLDKIEDGDIGDLLTKIESYNKLIEEFEIKTSNSESSMEIKKGIIVQSRMKLDSLRQEHQAKKTRNEEAKVTITSMDPNIVKLMDWYEESISFIKLIQDITKIEVSNNTETRIESRIANVSYKIVMKYSKNPALANAWSLNELSVCPPCIELSEIMQAANSEVIKSLKEMILYVVTSVTSSIKVHSLRNAEIQSLKGSKALIPHNEQKREYFIDSPKNQQKILISLSKSYPVFTGARGINILACYPYASTCSQSDLLECANYWQKNILKNDIKTLTELVNLCS